MLQYMWFGNRVCNLNKKTLKSVSNVSIHAALFVWLWRFCLLRTATRTYNAIVFPMLMIEDLHLHEITDRILRYPGLTVSSRFEPAMRMYFSAMQHVHRTKYLGIFRETSARSKRIACNQTVHLPMVTLNSLNVQIRWCASEHILVDWYNVEVQKNQWYPTKGCSRWSTCIF